MKRWSMITIVASMALLALLLASSSGAAPIGGTGSSCGSCQGSIYDLTYSPNGTTATTETFRITLTIDTSTYSGVGDYLDTVAIKVSSSFLDARLVSAPGGTLNWTEMSGGLNAAGCSGSGSGYDCVRFAAPLVQAPVVPGATYTWIFDIDVPTGTLFVGTDQASVKARYVNERRFTMGSLVSEKITMSPVVPEPGALAVFSIGLLVAGGLIARLKKD